MTVVPHSAFPLVFTSLGMAVVGQNTTDHVLQRAEVLLRTRPGDFEFDPDLGLADQVGTVDPVAPAVLDALDQFEPFSRFLTREDESALENRVRRVLTGLGNE